MRRLQVVLLALLLYSPLFSTQLFAGPSGVVINRTKGKPEARVPVTLISFAQGMDPIEEVYTDADGRFEFSKEVVGAGMLRTDHQAVGYSKMLRPGAMNDLEVEIYEVIDEPTLAPTGRVFVLEPGAGEMVINESYLYENQLDPPATFRDEARGTLRFYLPPEAKGIVQVEATGPARMPLKAVAEKTSEPNIYKVDFAIKPGENRISLTYLTPHPDGESEFISKSPYAAIQTRIAAPAGVELSGENLQSFGEEPSTKATIYEVLNGGDFRLTIKGQGRLTRSAPAPPAGGGSPNEISIEPAPIAKEGPLVMGLAAAILALGFFLLLTTGGKENADGRS